MNQETKTTKLCPVCKGTGLDFKNIWPDGSPSHCEECDGYGEVQKLTPQVKKALEKWVTKLLTDPVIINFNGRRRVIR